VRTINPMLPEDITPETLDGKGREEIEDDLLDHIEDAYEEREKAIEPEQMRYVERRMMLGAIDRQWVEYLTAMDELRQAINLQAYAQRDPLVEFKRRSFDMFDELKGNIMHDIVYQILPASFQYEEYLQRIRAEQEQRLAAAQRAGVEAEQARGARTVRKAVQLPGRNDMCPCGSGKKFKQCHLGREDEIMHILQGSAPSVSMQLATKSTGGNGKPQRGEPRSQELAAVGATAEGKPANEQSEQKAQPQRGQNQAPGAGTEQTKPTPRGRSAPPAAPARGKSGGKKGKKKKA
jgi:preprotein translocase subunit SecA